MPVNESEPDWGITSGLEPLNCLIKSFDLQPDLSGMFARLRLVQNWCDAVTDHESQTLTSLPSLMAAAHSLAIESRERSRS